MTYLLDNQCFLVNTLKDTKATIELLNPYIMIDDNLINSRLNLLNVAVSTLRSQIVINQNEINKMLIPTNY